MAFKSEVMGEADEILRAGRRVISEESDALTILSASLDERFVAAVEALLHVQGRVIVSGMGKSGHVARKIAATLASTGTPAIYVHPGEASHGDLGMVKPGDIVLALSRSGETGELGDLVAHAEAEGLVLIAMTGVAGSTLARRASYALVLPDVEEACEATRAPTTSTTLMMALGDAVAVALLERRGFTAADFKRFHPGGQLGARLRTVGDLMDHTRRAPKVAMGTSLTDALEIMSETGLGCVYVEGLEGQLAGIVTDGDIRRLVTEGRHVDLVDEVMTRDPITITPDAKVQETLSLMNDRCITQIVVMDDGRPIGVVHMHDFLRAGIG
ncbi:MAG: KpsF/GutQ family sugar-phosphate isomerase [Pseudomonadota bacterium]